MCDPAEIVRSQQLGISLPDGAWVASFDGTGTTGDCISWTDDTNNGGNVWNQSPPLIQRAGCDTAHAIACCD
jgi:hypothetical protein